MHPVLLKSPVTSESTLSVDKPSIAPSSKGPHSTPTKRPISPTPLFSTNQNHFSIGSRDRSVRQKERVTENECGQNVLPSSSRKTHTRVNETSGLRGSQAADGPTPTVQRQIRAASASDGNTQSSRHLPPTALFQLHHGDRFLPTKPWARGAARGHLPPGRRPEPA